MPRWARATPRAGRARGCPSSPQSLLREGSPEEREVWIERERPREPRSGRGAVAETALDHPAVEEEQRVPGPQPERADRVRFRLATPVEPEQAPGHRVIGVDARRRPERCTGAGQRDAGITPVVEVEDGGLELGSHPVGLEE